jgi:tRNA-dihydrouridine synthase B
MLSIGNITISNPLVLAPMSGISDLPFRRIARAFGCELAFTEMVNATSLGNKDKNTLRMLCTSPDDRPLIVQLLGGREDSIKRALNILSRYPFDIMDFNAACPVRKVVAKGRGAGLLREPARLESILRVVVANASAPVTVKIRSGWDESSINAVELALRAEDAGVNGLFIHGRTRGQGYGGTVDYDIIRKVKESLSVPVIASGDALTPVLIKKLFDNTGCDGVAIARGALGNPWIFPHAAKHLNNEAVPAGPDLREITHMMKAHLDMNIDYHGERLGVVRFRKFFGWYTKTMPVKKLKIMAFSACTREDMLLLIDEIESASSLPRNQ